MVWWLWIGLFLGIGVVEMTTRVVVGGEFGRSPPAEVGRCCCVFCVPCWRDGEWRRMVHYWHSVLGRDRSHHCRMEAPLLFVCVHLDVFVLLKLSGCF